MAPASVPGKGRDVTRAEREREARLRAVRRMQDDVYEGIGAERLYGRDGEDGVERPRASVDDMRRDARDTGRRLAIGGTQPLRDALDDEDEDDDMSAKRRKPAPKGY